MIRVKLGKVTGDTATQPEVPTLNFKVIEQLRALEIPDAVVIEIDDPKAASCITVGRTKKGVRIIKANRAAARKAARTAALRMKAMQKATV